MARTAKTLTQINHDDNSPDSPAVIAYRLGQVENAVKDGFSAHNIKLDNLINNFATKSEVLEVKSKASDEHLRIWNELKRVSNEVTSVQGTVDTISAKNVSLSWVQRIVFGGVAIALLALANGIVSQVIGK